MRRIVVSVGPALVAVLLSGCGTICNFAAGAVHVPDDPVARPAVYGGVLLDMTMITGMRPAQTSYLTVFVAGCLLADVPVSFVGDTLTLPITLWLEQRSAWSERDVRGIAAPPTDPETHVQAPSTARPNVGDPNP